MKWRKTLFATAILVAAGLSIAFATMNHIADRPASAADGAGSPAMVWNTFLGGTATGDSPGQSVCVDRRGNLYVIGICHETWGNPVRPYGGGDADAFVAKLNSSGELKWLTFLGGSGVDQGHDIAVDDTGNLYVAGTSYATWGSPIQGHSGSGDAFIAKLNANGELQWNTFVGGTGSQSVKGIGFDTAMNLYVAGTSDSSWGTPVHAFGGGTDAFVAKLGADGSFLWNSFLGSVGTDEGKDLAVDNAGNAYVVGTSAATWANPVDPFGGAAFDAFAAKLSSGGVLLWNTFCGGSGEDYGAGIALDAAGRVFVTGTSGADWGNPRRAYSGSDDAFAAGLDGNGARQWNTFLGGGGDDGGFDVALDGSGNVFLTGQVDSSGGTISSPTVYDAFAAKLDANGGLLWNLPFGGTQYDEGKGIAVADSGSVYVTGDSFSSWGSPTLPYTGAAFVARIADESEITVNSPDGGEVLVGGSPLTLTWAGSGSVANVKIEYSGDNGATWTTVTASTANTGSYLWSVPAVASTGGLIRIGEAQDGFPVDISDEPFTVVLTSPVIGLSKSSVSFGTEQNGTPTPPATVTVSNLGTGTLNWTAAASNDWISVAPGSGTGAGVLTIGVARTDLMAGDYTGSVTVTDPNASNSPVSIAVALHVTETGGDAAPFGDFNMPAEGATVVSSIPVTGWALDDISIQSVKIYRGTGLEDRVFIDDATLVRGARPDVEAAYPAYPENDKAGWGYMLLTNMLPGGGNGPFTLLAYATDTGGHEVLLGSKSITCNNAAATLPFGAIDTPTQGGTASGSAFSNFGWVLTPQPKSIPIDGSTITVWVDGQPKGHPVYNNYRADIATLFPGYVNSNGAVGYFYLDTTAYADGIHTIAWSVTDSGGATDGIGSRYFTVQNVAGIPPAAVDGTHSLVGHPATGIRPASDLDRILEEAQVPIYVKKGWGEPAAGAYECVVPGPDGSIRLSVPEVTPIVLALEEPGMDVSARTADHRTHRSGSIEAYELVRDELRPLPVGASFDPKTGVFSWIPGPGFVGEYTIVFLKNSSMGNVKKTVTIAVETVKKTER